MWDEVRGSSPFVLLVWFGFLPGFPFFWGVWTMHVPHIFVFRLFAWILFVNKTHYSVPTGRKQPRVESFIVVVAVYKYTVE